MGIGGFSVEAGLAADQYRLTAFGEALARPHRNWSIGGRGELYNEWGKLDPQWRVLLALKGEWEGNP